MLPAPALAPEQDDEEKVLHTIEAIEDTDDGSETSDPHEVAVSSASSGKLLLPGSVASLVSFATRSSSVSLRLGTWIGRLAIDGARVSTLTGLEFSRVVLEHVFMSGGNEVVDRSGSQLRKGEAENVLERSIATLHSTVTQASFVISTGFHFSSAALSSASTLSLHLLSALDSILGSTESSRAIASIITLIRKEFRNPETGIQGERVGVVDLLVGLTGLALLQRWCDAETLRERAAAGENIVIWDLTILENGGKAEMVSNSGKSSGSSLESLSGAHPGVSLSDPSDMSMTGENDDLRSFLATQLPPQAQVSVRTDTITTKVITVEVSGVDIPHLSPPPGTHILEESSREIIPPADGPTTYGNVAGVPGKPQYRIVFQTQPVQGDTEADAKETTRRVEVLERPLPSPSGQPPTPLSAKFMHSPINSPLDDDESNRFAEQASFFPTSDERPNGYMPDHLGIYAESPAAEANPDQSIVPAFEGTSAPQNGEKGARKPPHQLSALERLTQPTFATAQKAESRQGPKGKQLADKEKSDKKGPLRRALKKGTSNTNLSNFFNRDALTVVGQESSKGPESRLSWGSSKGEPAKRRESLRRQPLKQRESNSVSLKSPPRVPSRGSPNYFSSQDVGRRAEPPRSASRTSFYSVHERRRESIVSQTDTFSIKSVDPSRPPSPVQTKLHVRAESNLSISRSQPNQPSAPPPAASPPRRRRHQKPASIYTLKSNASNASLVPAKPQSSGGTVDAAAVSRLQRDGQFGSGFPDIHLVKSLRRFSRFASASYGSNFLRFMGIREANKVQTAPHEGHHHEHSSFSRHVGLPPSTILLSSFVDDQNLASNTSEPGAGIPLVHFVSLDHESRAVVLTCRGTLGFEDVLTDLTCDYDVIVWRGRRYGVHQGMHASARRLLHGAGRKAIATIKAALEEFEDYGLVLCGHSLGGGVAALLALMITEKSCTLSGETTFLTTSQTYGLQAHSSTGDYEAKARDSSTQLPSGRPVRVFAYGPPASVSASLQTEMRGLVTTVVNGQDIVPYLSLGTLRDLQAVALAFKTDTSGAKGEVRQRVWDGLKQRLLHHVNGGDDEDFYARDAQVDEWAYSALKSLRASMLSSKLMPPGDVFMVETQPVYQREGNVSQGQTSVQASTSFVRPARRVVLTYVKDVESRFAEFRFGAAMLGDHSPGRYERTLAALEAGVFS